MLICVPCSAGQAADPNAYDWRYPKQVHEFGSLNIELGDITIEAGPGALVYMEARPGIVGAVIVASGRVEYKSATTGEDITDHFETVMLRFHHKDYEHILTSKNLKAAEDPSTLQRAMAALRQYFYGCYNSERLVCIPPQGTLAIVFNGKTYGEKILIHYNPTDSYIMPSMPELQARKALATFPVPDMLTRGQQWQHDLLYLSKLLPIRHPDLFSQLPQKAFNTQIDSLCQRVAQMSEVEIFLSLRKIFAEIGDSHTTIGPPNELLSMYPIEFNWFSDGLFVIAAVKGYEQSLKTRLVKIGNAHIDTIYRTVSTIIPHENESQVRKESLYMIRMPRMLEGLGVVSEAESHRLTFKTAGGHCFVLDVDAVPWNGWRQVQRVLALDRTDPSLPISLQKNKDNYWYEYIEPSLTLYCQYNRCKEMKGKPMADFTRELLGFLDTHRVDRFILDMRKNTGGHSPLLDSLTNGLAESQVNHRGKLFCLIGRQTFSSAILNAVKLKRDTQAILVGEPTSGKPYHLGQVESMRLPYSKIRVQYSTQYCGDSSFDSPTLAPDITVQLSSIDFFAGRDPVLDAVLAYPRGADRTRIVDTEVKEN
jgi:hypothetical protein